MPRSFCLSAAAILSLAAMQIAPCQQTPEPSAPNPHYKTAQQDLDNNNATAAAAEYEAALAENPSDAEAHYQLGMIYAEKLNDPISGIYHFKHFLAVAPQSDHAPNAKQMIEIQSRLFAATVPAEPGAEDPATLAAENSALKKQVSDAAQTITTLQAQLARANAQSTTIVAASTPDTTGAAPAGPMKALPLDAPNPALEGTNAAPGASAIDTTNAKTYTVVKGDTIWRIAHRMYPGHTKDGVEKIEDANKDAIGTKPLKIGQVLLIPQ